MRRLAVINIENLMIVAVIGGKINEEDIRSDRTRRFEKG